MKKLLTLLVLSLFLGLSACQLAKFDRVPGNGIMALPPQIQGEFACLTSSFAGMAGTDSILVKINGTSLQLQTKRGTFNKVLGQDFQATELNKKTVLGFPDQNIPGLWNLFVVELAKTELKVYPLIDNRVSKEDLGLIGTYLPQQNLILNHDPISPQFIPTINSNGEMSSAPPINPAAGFQSKVEFYAMMDDQFIQFFENELKGKAYLSFKAINKQDPAKKKK